MMNKLVCIIVLASAPALVGAQPYAVTQAPTVNATMFGSISLADFDGDGDLDMLITGSEVGSSRRTMRIYRNDGRLPSEVWSFTNVEALFPDAELYLSGIRASSTDIADFDNDGDLDVLLSGPGGTVVYRNEGAYRFTPIRVREEANLAAGSYFVDIVTSASAAWGDYDNDGDLDILVAGRTGSYIYRNDGFARFTQVDVGLPVLANGIVSWGDFDNDGDLDILAVSRPFNDVPPSTRIFRNDGGTFVDIGANLPGIEAGTIRWGDYDNDGDLDVLVMSRLFTGSSATRPGIYRNDRGTFVRTDDELPSAWYGEWIDFDQDGDLDILVNGIEGSGTHAQFIRNDNGRFEHRTTPFAGIWFGDITAGDIDGNGGVDILMTGRYQVGAVRTTRFTVFRHTQVAADKRPPPPTSLASRRDDSRLVLSWDTPNPHLEEDQSFTYNIRVGTTPGASDVIDPMSLQNGKRLIPERGNAGHNRTFVVNGLRPDRAYFWSVQAVDHRQVGSEFAAERESLPVPPRPNQTPATENYPNPFNPSTTIRYALPTADHVRLTVYNVLGVEVAVLAEGRMESGVHEAVWNGTDAAGTPVASGVYLYTLQAGETRITRRMLLLK